MNEAMIKYLSGLIDSDGSISFSFGGGEKSKDRQHLRLTVGIATSKVIDKHGFIESLPEKYGFGYITRQGRSGYFPLNEEEKPYLQWLIRSRSDLEMLVPRFVKHMFVKGRHLQRMFDKWKEMRGIALSEKECDELRDFSKKSRYDPGPLKPKNHPSWGWMAGYLDGNGVYTIGEYKVRGKPYPQLKVRASCHANDAEILLIMQKFLGGSVLDAKRGHQCKIWSRNLGSSERAFALHFLRKVVQHAQFKRHKIEQLISFHTHPQRLSGQTPEGESIV